MRGALARRAARAEATQAGTRAARRATRPTPTDPPAGTDAEHDGAGTGPFRTPSAVTGHDANTNGNGPTDQGSPEPRTIPPTPVSSGEGLSTAAIPTAAWAAASQAALTRTQEDASDGVLTTSVTSVTPSDGSPSCTSQEATPVTPSDALLVGTEECASADAPDDAWTVTEEDAPAGTPGAPSAATRHGASAGTPGAPSAATRHGASVGTPAGGPSATTGKGASAGAPDTSPAATWDGASAGAPDASSGTTRQGAAAGTPDGVSAVMGEEPSAGVPGAPSAAAQDGASAGSPDAPSAVGEGTSTGTPEVGSEGRRAYGRRTSTSSAGAGSGSAAFSPARAGAEPPVPPRVPRTMASPRRDGELRRTFPAFPARAVEGERFAETWWGDAWVDALEEGALDAARLARGRGYAQTGHVDAVTVTPGLVLAYVQGSRPRPYRVQVRLRTLDDADWDRFLDAVAERPGHIAALLDKEMPQSLADCGVPLLPGPGDLEPHCSCPDRGHPCKHAAALCYQTARLLDADPFVLLLLRGRGERELLDALSRLNATRAARAAQEREPEPFPGVRAGEALAERRRPPLPAPLPAPPHPEQPPVYPAAPGGPDSFDLDQLATDAAARAHALLTTGRDPLGGLTLWQDAVRLAAARPGSGLTAATRSLYASLASATGRGTAELARAVAAWRQGGLEGLAVLEEPWDPPAGRFDRARPLLLAADLPAFRPWRNRLTHPRGHLQLRLGRDGLWYAYESEPDRDDWWPRGTPDLDPVGALTGLGAPGAL
ncbi:SWIM zinc finger family protein [Streptomyces sp. NPDC056190]|uniref:SWIM zinc finger family protein n=1 Tax=Streptomyces sp. NPDC056190 TaxID=3345741 RepID=UPI0035DC84DA